MLYLFFMDPRYTIIKGRYCIVITNFQNFSPPVSEDEKYFRKQPLKTQEVFKELISQRLAQVQNAEGTL